MKKHLIALALVASLVACSSEPVPVPKFEQTGGAKISLDVTDLAVYDRSSPPSQTSPYNTNHFHPTITQAIRQWAADHMQAAGVSGGQGSFNIKDASLTIEPVPPMQDTGLMDKWFTRQQTTKYVAHAEVEIQVKGRQGYAVATAEATHFETLPENPSETERQTAYVNVLNSLMRDLDQNIQTSVEQHLRDFSINGYR